MDNQLICEISLNCMECLRRSCFYIVVTDELQICVKSLTGLVGEVKAILENKAFEACRLHSRFNPEKTTLPPSPRDEHGHRDSRDTSSETDHSIDGEGYAMEIIGYIVTIGILTLATLALVLLVVNKVQHAIRRVSRINADLELYGGQNETGRERWLRIFNAIINRPLQRSGSHLEGFEMQSRTSTLPEGNREVEINVENPAEPEAGPSSGVRSPWSPFILDSASVGRGRMSSNCSTTSSYQDTQFEDALEEISLENEAETPIDADTPPPVPKRKHQRINWAAVAASRESARIKARRERESNGQK